MNLIRKTKIYLDACLAERSNIPLQEFFESREKTIMEFSPKGEVPFSLSIQADGSTLRTEIQRDEAEDISDELFLRKKYGDKYSDSLQRKAVQIQEEISNCEIGAREAMDSLREVREGQENLIKNSHDLYFMRSEVFKDILPFIIIAMGEVAMLFFLIADIFGLDPLKIRENALKFPLTTFFSLFASVGIFLMFVKLAEKILSSRGFLLSLWIVCLTFLALGVGIMRAQQLSALHEGSTTGFLSPLIYFILSFGLSLTAAKFKISCQNSGKNIGMIKSCSRRLSDLGTFHVNILEKAIKNRSKKARELENIIKQYSIIYQRTEAEKEKFKDKWEIHLRRVESYLSELKIAYKFWESWRKKQLKLPKLLKTLPIALPLLAFLLFSLFGCQVTEAQIGYNLFIICDRSSSASEFACSKENIQEAAHVWVEKADEAGGGVFEVHIIGHGFDSTKLLISESYPDRFPGPVSLNKKAWRDAFFQKISEKTANLPNDMGSAIVEAIYRCSLRIPDNGNTLFVVASDMREVNESYNFERKVPSPEEFSRWLDSRSIKPNFPSSTRIIICGVHPYTPYGTSTMTTANYGKVVNLWNRIFEKWGVKINISEMCDFRDY